MSAADEDPTAAHNPQPMSGVDAAPFHRLVDELTAALHSYVDTAVGVRAEFGSTEADEDPRLLALENRVGTLNARLYDLLHGELGMHPELTGMIWEGEEPGHPEEDERATVDEFHLGFVIGLPAEPTDQTAEAALGLIDNGGADLVERLIAAGFSVQEWGSSRGAPVGFDDEDPDGDDR
ncbi:hypothetical protein [Cellulomonas denverensis]|nr:hypothetical protein [Cellulomonas denverensis]GIG26030.1 hypothetical protein Cde04nite_22740 [Cellulomonas denverensis]